MALISKRSSAELHRVVMIAGLIMALAAGTLGVLIIFSSRAASPVGDINGDGKIDILDLSTLLSKWGTTDASSDLNSSGSVDITDLSILMSHYGQVVPVSTSPSGISMPVGDITGTPWKQVFAEDFNTNVASSSTSSGGFLSNSAYSTKWGGYGPYKNNNVTGFYCPSKVVSVSGGLLNKHLFHGNCGSDANDLNTTYRLDAALLPKIPSAYTTDSSGATHFGLLYGRYAVRFKADRLPNFYAAWLLWPDVVDPNQWALNGEIDWPEGQLAGSMSAFIHQQGGTVSSTGQTDPSYQTSFNSGVNFADGQWHTAVTEWLPNRVNIILDDRQVFTTTYRIPNTYMHYVLQTEVGFTNNTSDEGNVQVDWFTAYKYVP